MEKQIEKSLEPYHKLLGADKIQQAWSQVYYGPNAKPIETIGKGLVKRALGHYVEWGMHFLLTELGLTDELGNVTKLGHEFLNIPYKAI